jgi:prepilin-type N-terminal cleavage/methylation domain-containing protein
LIFYFKCCLELRILQMNRMFIKRGQRGFSLVELVIVVALAGLVCTVIAATAFQVFTFNTRMYNQMTAIRQVQQAGFWVSPDVMMAKTVVIDGSPGVLLRLSWEEGGTGVTHNVTYTLVDMSGGLKMLQREHYIGTSLNSTTTVAQYITSASFVKYGGAYNLTVTATVGGQTETRIYQVMPRPGT